MTSEKPDQLCRLVVHQARRLKAKGADGSCSSPFVKMTCGKERFITSIADKSPNPKWNQDCEFNLTKGEPCVELLVFHRGKLLDDFLGMVTIHPIRDQGEHSISRKWYKLQHRPNKVKKDGTDRGEIDITVEVIESGLEYLSVDGDFEGSEVIGQSRKAKRSSSLSAMTPGSKSKLTVSRLKSYISVHRDSSTSQDFVAPEREKSNSNDSGKASDSLESESPTSIRRMSSHNASENFGSEESLEYSGKDRKGGLKKRMKNAFGSLKREKTPRKDSSDSPYSSSSSLPSAAPDDTHLRFSRNDPQSPSVPSDEPSRPPPPLPKLRNRVLSTSDLQTTPTAKEPCPLSYPLRSISEDHIPLQVLYSQADSHSTKLGSDSEQRSSEDIKLRHSFRSGLPSLRKSNVSVTFDPAAMSGYGTKMDGEGPLPPQYLNMKKEALIRRLLLKEQMLRERQKYIRELEDYTDNLLLKVMLESPRLLERNFDAITKR